MQLQTVRDALENVDQILANERNAKEQAESLLAQRNIENILMQETIAKHTEVIMEQQEELEALNLKYGRLQQLLQESRSNEAELLKQLEEGKQREAAALAQIQEKGNNITVLKRKRDEMEQEMEQGKVKEQVITDLKLQLVEKEEMLARLNKLADKLKALVIEKDMAITTLAGLLNSPENSPKKKAILHAFNKPKAIPINWLDSAVTTNTTTTSHCTNGNFSIDN